MTSRTLSLLVWPLAFVAGLAHAQVADAGLGAAACEPLMTEAECRRHLDTLAGLRDPAALRAYLAAHLALMREREAFCACGEQPRHLARAAYR